MARWYIVVGLSGPTAQYGSLYEYFDEQAAEQLTSNLWQYEPVQDESIVEFTNILETILRRISHNQPKLRDDFAVIDCDTDVVHSVECELQNPDRVLHTRSPLWDPPR